MVDNKKIDCDECRQSFNSRKQMEQHKQNVHRARVTKHLGKSSRLSKNAVAIIIVVAAGVTAVIIVAVGVYPALTPRSSLSSSSPLSIDNIQCNSMEQSVFHIHAHMDIIINGQYFAVPALIGITPDKCFFWLHTHDESGVIHIESPVNKEFTVGQFFDIWNKKFNNNQIFDKVVNGRNTLSVYFNGNKEPNGVNYRDTKLHAHDEIAIVYGTAPSTIPSSYNFPEGL